MQAPGKVFKDTTISVAARVRAMHLPAQELTVELLLAGKAAGPDQRQTLKHLGGDAVTTSSFNCPWSKLARTP